MRTPRGFTLVEVLVALAAMAVIAALGWQGVDSMLRTREISQASSQRTLRLVTVVAQWEQDLQALQDTPGVPALNFDGASLRLTRAVPDGMQLVTWSVRDGRWLRWASPTVRRQGDLQEAWMRSHQLLGNEDGQVRMMDEVAGWRLHVFRGSAWANAQSSGDAAAAPQAPASAPAGTPPREQLPTGVRLFVDLPRGTLVRDVMLAPQRP